MGLQTTYRHRTEKQQTRKGYNIMKITKEVDIDYIRSNSWSGAADRVKDLTDSDLTTILNILEETGDTMTETELNDFLWFDDDIYADWLGYKDAEDLWHNR